MLKSFAKFVYILIFSDFLIKKLFKRSYLNFLYEYIRQNSYSKLNILNKDVKFLHKLLHKFKGKYFLF